MIISNCELILCARAGSDKCSLLKGALGIAVDALARGTSRHSERSEFQTGGAAKVSKVSSLKTVVDWSVQMPMRDGTKLVADVYRPDSGRWPVLVTRTPYGRYPYPDNFVCLPPLSAARRGFAVVVQDVRGRGASEGDFQPFEELDDSVDTVAWAAAQPWSTGEVGCFGSSYMGAAALQAALGKHPALRAVACLQASSDYYEGRTYRGGALEFGAVVSLGLGALGADAMNRVEPSSRTQVRSSFTNILAGLAETPVTFPITSRLGGQDGALNRLSPWCFDWIKHDQRDEYWQRLSLEERYTDVVAAGLHITGWFDAMKDGVLRNYAGITRAARTQFARQNQRLIVGPWSHYALRGYQATAIGDMAFGIAAAAGLDETQLRWFEEHLDGADHAAVSTTSQPVRLFVMGTNVWRDEPTWPLQRASMHRLHLSSNGNASGRTDAGRLEREVSATPGEDRFDFDPRFPVPTLGGAHLLMPTLAPVGPKAQWLIEARPDVAVYTGEILSEELEATGDIVAELWVMTSAPSTDFTAHLVDVHPDGTPMSVCDGILRLSPGQPGELRHIQILLGATSHTFLRRHRIRLDISSSNFPRYDPNPNTGLSSRVARDCQVAHQRILHGGATPSCLILPVVRTTADGGHADHDGSA